MAEERRRFFVEPNVLESGEVTITGDLAHRLARASCGSGRGARSSSLRGVR